MHEAFDLTPRQMTALRLLGQGWHIRKDRYSWLVRDGSATRLHGPVFLSFLHHGWITNNTHSTEPERYDLTLWGKQIAEGPGDGRTQ
jgi:hypothetical protein